MTFDKMLQGRARKLEAEALQQTAEGNSMLKGIRDQMEVSNLRRQLKVSDLSQNLKCLDQGSEFLDQEIQSIRAW